MCLVRLCVCANSMHTCSRSTYSAKSQVYISSACSANSMCSPSSPLEGLYCLRSSISALICVMVIFNGSSPAEPLQPR